MPLTLPDGQTPIDYLDLESVGSVEVHARQRSALYGNASGGVIDLHSVDPPDVAVAAQLRARGPGAARCNASPACSAGRSAGVGYEGNIGHTHERRLSRSSRISSSTNAFARATTQLGTTQLALIGIGMDMPVAENPGALTLAQADSAPQQADALSVTKKARKAVHQVQVGLSSTTPVLGDGEVVAQVYGGTRSLLQSAHLCGGRRGRRQGGAGARVTLPWTIGSTSTIA